MRFTEIIAQPPEREQTVVGVGSIGKPLQHYGQQLSLNRRASRDSIRQGLDVSQSTT